MRVFRRAIKAETIYLEPVYTLESLIRTNKSIDLKTLCRCGLCPLVLKTNLIGYNKK